MKLKKVFITTIFIGMFLLNPSLAFANIMCVDGTESPTCSYCHQGCCSHHGGCASRNYYSDYEEDNYDEEEYDDEEYDDEDDDDEEDSEDENNYIYEDEDEDKDEENHNGEVLIPLLVAGGGIATSTIYSKKKKIITN